MVQSMKYYHVRPAPSLASDLEMAQVEHASAPVARMVIKTAHLTCQVDDFSQASAQMERAVVGHHGYVVSSTFQSANGSARAGRIQARVPSIVFEQILDTLASFASVVRSRSVQGNDVTEEFYDVSARLENKRKVEARYREILRSAKSVKAILEVEEALANVRDEIDKMEGRKKFLADQTALSTVTVDLAEPLAVTAIEGPGFWPRIGDGFRNGFNDFAVVLSLSITFLIASIPVVVLLAVLVYSVLRVVRRLRPSKPPIPEKVEARSSSKRQPG